MAAGQLSNALRHIRQLLGGPGGSDWNDRELLAHFAAHGDENAFATLVRRHGGIVLGVCRRILDNEHDAEDAFQATFLVLARKARSVHWRESVANWLYEVAYRTAQRARSRRGLRQQHERQAAAMQTKPASDAAWHELRQVLDDELMYLPEKYRMPLLLCYLHGKSREEAAQELGCTLQQLKGSLERGKEFLRGRLTRRGLSLSAALLTTLLSANAVSAVPATLLTNTIQSATNAAPAVAALAQGVIQAMFWKKAKLAAFVLLILGVVGSGGFMAFRGGSALSGPVALAAPLPESLVKNLPENIRGQKVLYAFHFVEKAPRGDRETKAAGIRAALKRAAVDLVEVVVEEEHSELSWRYHACLLLDCKDQAPAEAVAKLPWRKGGIVFRNGNYHEGLANENPEPGEKKGDVPAPYACQLWGFIDLKNGKRDKDLERFRSIQGMKTEYLPPPPLSGGGAGSARLWAEAGKRTLLEVFLLTKAGFFYVDPNEVPRRDAKASKPAVKDGLAVTLTLSKSTFAPEEKPGFEIAYENRTDKAFRLYDVGYEVTYFTYKRVDNGTSFQVGPWEYAARPTPQSVSVDPGKAHIGKFVVSGPFQSGNARAESLPPGKYSLTATIGFGRGADNDPPYWVGNITTNPAELEIVDKPAADAKAAEPPEKMSVEQLVAALDSADGSKRLAATKEIFRRGRGILPDLQKAGAKPAQTIQPPRRDMVYSLLEGSFPGRYTTGHFGLHLNPGVTRKDVSDMGKKYGFSLGENDPFNDNGHPNCYVALAGGKSLPDVLRQVLSEEPRVVTVNLNYVER